MMIENNNKYNKITPCQKNTSGNAKVVSLPHIVLVSLDRAK